MAGRSDPVTNFGFYVVEALLGRGSMGSVYLARDSRIGRRVALKTIQIDDHRFEDGGASAEFFLRLQREAEVYGVLHHPNIVTLYEAGYESNRISFLALEYVPGETLLDLLKRNRPGGLPVETAVKIAANVLNALSYAHERGIIHRDIKPANILITPEGAAKIADFGIARPQTSKMTVAGSIMGTPNYMSPEQARGLEATPRSDLFSFGVTMFEMLTNTKPFTGPDLHSILQKIVSASLPPILALNPAVGPDLANFVTQLTAKDPHARFQSAREALDELRRAADVWEAPQRDTEPESAKPMTLGVAPVPGWDQRAQEIAAALRRPVRARTFWTLVISALLAAMVPLLLIVPHIDDSPTAVIPPEKLSEFSSKRLQLRRANALFVAEKYEESLRVYETYLTRYPHSIVAREGAAAARERLGKSRRADSTERRRSRDPGVTETIKRRLRRVLRGD